MGYFLIVVLLPGARRQVEQFVQIGAPPGALAVAGNHHIQRRVHAQIKCWNPPYSVFKCEIDTAQARVSWARTRESTRASSFTIGSAAGRCSSATSNTERLGSPHRHPAQHHISTPSRFDPPRYPNISLQVSGGESDGPVQGELLQGRPQVGVLSTQRGPGHLPNG